MYKYLNIKTFTPKNKGGVRVFRRPHRKIHPMRAVMTRRFIIHVYFTVVRSFCQGIIPLFHEIS
ncbi:MAG: hypothetical protein DBY36_08595 [Clostridiales bacterium]|nr:MAG: hypothetical protein DBY36_08595 [Clostridiales bacterium]